MKTKADFSRHLIIIGAAIGCLISAPAGLHAAPDAQRTDSPALQRWNSLPPAEQQRILENYKRYQALNHEERQKLKDRWEDFRKLPADKQARIRANWQKWNSLSPQQRDRIRQRYQAWQHMTPAQRANLRAEILRRRQQKKEP